MFIERLGIMLLTASLSAEPAAAQEKEKPPEKTPLVQCLENIGRKISLGMGEYRYDLKSKPITVTTFSYKEERHVWAFNSDTQKDDYLDHKGDQSLDEVLRFDYFKDGISIGKTVPPLATDRAAYDEIVDEVIRQCDRLTS